VNTVEGRREPTGDSIHPFDNLVESALTPDLLHLICT
jgi:hypothetical protein